MCDKACNGCPFSFTEESEMIQNYGCLPTPQDIVRMRVEFGKTWACHAEPSKPCAGGIDFLRKKGYDYKVIDKVLVTETSDFLVGFGKLLKAEENNRLLQESNARLLQDSRGLRSQLDEIFKEQRKRGKNEASDRN